ncbi:MAG: cytochrome b [Parasphingorhabdus sp.]
MIADTDLDSQSSGKAIAAMKSDVSDYRVAQKVVHWLMAILIMLDLYIAQKFGGVMEDWDRFESRTDHASVGTIVTILFIIRIYLRWKHGAPPLPETMPRWQKWAAHFGHWGLYILIGCLIASGILSAINANSVIEPFGLFVLADGKGAEAGFLLFRQFHELVTDAIIALIGIHILAALYHLIFTSDRSTQRMLRFWSSTNK